MNTAFSANKRKLAIGIVASCLGLGATVSFAEYVGPFDDELGLSDQEQRRQNNVSYGLILGQIAVHNASIPIGFVPYPVWVGYAAEFTGLTVDNTLKFTKAYLQEPADIMRLPNSADNCSYDFELPQTNAEFDAWLGLFPKLVVEEASGSRTDRLLWPFDDPIDFGELGTPVIAHANTEVKLGVTAPSLGFFSGMGPGPVDVSATAGHHGIEWRADTQWYPVWDLAIPLTMTAIMIGVEFKFGSQIKRLKQFLGKKAGALEGTRNAAIEVASIKSNTRQLAKQINALNRRIDVLSFLSKYADDLIDVGKFVGGESVGEFVVEQIFEGKTTVSRARSQTLTVYDVWPPSISTTEPTRTLEATDIGGTTYSRYAAELLATIVASDNCNRKVTVGNDAPEVLPLGETVVTWTVRDLGPALSNQDHDGDGDVDDDDFYSRTVQQVITVEDTQPPIMVPPPGLVIESDVTVNLDSYPLGQPLVVDLADLHPDVSKSTNSPDGNVTPDTRTVVTWSAADDAQPVPNVATAEQLVTVKTPGTNNAPTAQANSAETLTSEPVDIVLTGTDPDLLPYSHDLLGPTVPDPLQFRIEQPPQNGEFVAPLLPFFIDEYRTDKTGGLIDYINSQPDAEQLMDAYILAVNTNNIANFLNNEFCRVGAEAPVDFIYDPLYVQVTDNGEQYFFDHYLVCDPNGNGDTAWDERFRFSRWDRNSVFLGHVRIDDNGGGGIPSEEAIFHIDEENFIYFVQPRTGGEQVVSIQRCTANFTDQSLNPPFCQQQGFGPVDSNDVSEFGWYDPDNAYVDIERELVYVAAGAEIAVFDYRREDPTNPNSPRHRSSRIGWLTDDLGGTQILGVNNGCNDAIGASKVFLNTIEVDSKGNLYVTDTQCHRIHKFSPSYFDEEGTFVKGQYVGWAGKCDTSNNLACDDANQRTKGFSCTATANCRVGDNGTFTGNESGGEIGQFFNPAFIAIDPNDILYVADYDNLRIQRFGVDGTFAGVAASTGNGVNAKSEGGFVLGNMGPPKHVSVNSKNFFVVDQSEHFVHIFDTSPFKDITDSSATVTYVSEFAFHSNTDTFAYSVNDGLVDSNVAQVTIDVPRNYRQPLPTARIVDVKEDNSVIIVLSGTDPDGILDRDFNGLDTLTFSVTEQPESGTLTKGGDPGDMTIDPGMEVWTYTPDRDFFGADSIQFTVRDEFTDATDDNDTPIPEPYGEAEPALVSINIESVNDIPIVKIVPPVRVATGFPVLLRGMVYDDFGTDHAASVSWGDGVTATNGEIIVDDNDTPNDFSDDTAEMVGIVFSQDGLNNIGMSTVNAMHTYDTPGGRTIRLCMKDAGLLEACTETTIVVEDLVAIGAELDLEVDEIIDGVVFDGTLSVGNGEPVNGVTGNISENVTASMELPPELVVSNFVTADGVCNIIQSILECDFGSLAVGEVATVDLQLHGSGVLVYDALVDLALEARTTTPAIEEVALSTSGVNILAVDLDRDADGMPNIFEASNNVEDPDGDDDGDGLTNVEEFEAGTSAASTDTDGDGISDFDELTLYGSDPLETDSDNDSLSDADEINIHQTDPTSKDSDGDGLPDDWELDNGFDPVVHDSSGDADLDGLSDADEYVHDTDYLNPDSDGDNLTDGDEITIYGSDPTLADTDDDGLNDDDEVLAGTIITKPDTDDDGLLDGTEVAVTATLPLISDTDRDGLPDGFEDRNIRDPLKADYAVSAGGLSTCAITDTGVECWGRNNLGQAPAVVTGLNDPQYISMGFAHGCAINRANDGQRSVVCWGDDTYGQRTGIPPMTEPVQIASGAYHNCALDQEFADLTTLKCWGRDNLLQVSNAPANLESPLRLVSSISGSSSCVLDNTTSGPTLLCWGQYNNANSSVPAGPNNAVSALALGSEHGCVVDGGQRLCWGLNDDGQAPAGPNPSVSVELALGGFHSCSLESGSPNFYSVDCWGSNIDGQATIPDTLVQPLGLAAGSHHSCAFDQGSAKCWGVETQFDFGQAVPLTKLDIDPDGDGIDTATEIGNGTDPLDSDTDRDQVDDATEALLGTNPNDIDSDDDGLNDGDEINVHGSNPLDSDTDGDGMLDHWEVGNGLNLLLDDADGDADGDGLNNGAEHAVNSNPNVGDSDDDGLDDLAELAIFTYEDSGQIIGNDISEAVVLGDLDGDDDLDAVISNRNGPVRISFNNGFGDFDPVFSVELTALGALDADVADIDNDGDLDIALAHEANGQSNTVWLNDGIGNFTDSGFDRSTGVTDAIKLGNLSPTPDIVSLFAGNWGENTAHVFLPSPGPTTILVVDNLGGNTEDIAVGDLDGDNLDDVFVVNRNQPNQVIFSSTSPGDLIDSGQLLGNDSSTAVDLGDVDGDGDLDAYEVIFGSGDKLWLNNGGGFFVDTGQSIGSDGGSDVAVIDVDRDGDLDAVVANSGINRVWLNTGDGTLFDSGVTFGGGSSFGVGAGDLNGDQLTDLYVANDGANQVWMLRQLDPTTPDTDNDGMYDGWELSFGFDPLDGDDALGDDDGDGLTNYEEFDANTVPQLADSDGDGMPDGWEVANALDPTLDDSAGDLDRDGLNNLGEYQQGMAAYGDDVPPVLTMPEDVLADSIGAFTDVDLGTATAIDARDGAVSAVASDTGPFAPGPHDVTWTASDFSGNRTEDNQAVGVVPLIDFTVGQVVDEGASVIAPLMLNGPAVDYPVQVNYTVSGAATNPEDHNAADGSVMIESGVDGGIPINIVLDPIFEGIESFTLSFTDVTNAVPGVQTSHTLTITQVNVKPVATIVATQMGETVTTAVASSGPIDISASVFDPNSGDAHLLDWAVSDSGIFDPSSASAQSYTIDPSTLNPGFYRIVLDISDDGSPAASNRVETLLQIIADAPALSASDDTDGDGIDDLTEGFDDSDGDRIPDYRDDESAGANVIAYADGRFVLQTQPGLSFRLGETAYRNGAFAGVSEADVLEDAEVGFPNLIADFEVLGVEPGATATVVIPMRYPIPANASYRKFIAGSWQAFVVDDNNSVSTSAGSDGACAAPGDASYASSLNVGDGCVQLTIQDGGPNDIDGLANGIIRDPGGLAVPVGVRFESLPAADVSTTRGTSDVVILAFSLESDSGDAELDGLTLQASGSGDDGSIRAIRLVVDENQNGAVDADEASIADGTFGQDDGTLELQMAAPYLVPPGRTDFLITYDF